MLETLDAMRTSEDELVRRSRDGDTLAQGLLFERFRNDCYRVAYRLLGHEQDALDVVQEAMIKVFTAIPEFDGRCSLRTWILRIVTNTALDWGRRRRHLISLQDEGFSPHDEPTLDEDPGRRVRQRELGEILQQALDRLSPTLKKTFVLFAELEMTYAEIAEVEGVPIGTVMSRIHAARTKLHSILDWNRLSER